MSDRKFKTPDEVNTFFDRAREDRWTQYEYDLLDLRKECSADIAELDKKRQQALTHFEQSQEDRGND